MVKKKVIISACLLGEYCRYDGKTKKINEILKAYKDYEIIPFCPEAPIFGTPRQRISVLKIDDTTKIVTDETNEDVTIALDNEINSFIANNKEVDSIILKSKSPSCGLGTTPVLNNKKEVLGFGNGIAAEIFLKKYPNAKISDESEYLF